MPRITRTTRIAWVLSLALLITFAGAAARADHRPRSRSRRGEPITLSDVTAAMRFGFVPDAPGGQDRVQAALDALIERQLQLIEVNRYLPPEPPAAEVDARLAPSPARDSRVRRRFEKAMTETGVTLDAAPRPRPRRPAHRELSSGSASAGPISQAMTKSLVTTASHESDFMRNGVAAAVSRKCATRRGSGSLDERTAALVRDWVAGLRRRTDVTILPR